MIERTRKGNEPSPPMFPPPSSASELPGSWGNCKTSRFGGWWPHPGGAGERGPGAPKTHGFEGEGEGGRGNRTGGGSRRGEKGRGRDSTGTPSGWAVFSVQPRNGRLKFLVLRLEKNALLPPQTTLTTHSVFQTKKNQAHKLHPQMYTHKINSLEHQEQRTTERLLGRAPAARTADLGAAPRRQPASARPGPAGRSCRRRRGAPSPPSAPAARLSPSGENILRRGSGISGFRTCWLRDSNFKRGWSPRPAPTREAAGGRGPWEAAPARLDPARPRGGARPAGLPDPGAGTHAPYSPWPRAFWQGLRAGGARR
nr:uncharacterized protein LOC123569031 [Macaca fascicularis]